MSDFICQKYTDCSSCSHYQKQIFKYRSFPKGMMIPKERCSQNTIYFLISGSVRVTSERASGYGISRRAVHHAADRFTCRVPHPGIHGMHPLPVRDSAKHLYRPFQQRTGTGEMSLPCSLSSWICVSLCAFLSTGLKCTSTTNSCVWNS